MVERNLFGISFVAFLSFVDIAHLFEIKDCSSDIINVTVARNAQKKAKISVGNDQIIDPDINKEFRIWCESDTLLSKCTLEHLIKSTSNKACEDELPFPCEGQSDSKSCKNPYENIKMIQTSNHRCEFQFTKVKETGMLHIN